MKALDVLQQLHELGVMLTPLPDGTVRYRASQGVLTPVLLDVIRQHKQDRARTQIRARPALGLRTRSGRAHASHPPERCLHGRRFGSRKRRHFERHFGMPESRRYRPRRDAFSCGALDVQADGTPSDRFHRDRQRHEGS